MTGALNGVKILDFSSLLPGPYATMTLADLGADVLKISGKDIPDLMDYYPPILKESKISAPWGWLGRNKKSIYLNLKKPAAIRLIKKLIMEYDVIVEQFRPGVMKKLGLDYQTLKEINPRLVMCSLTGYGQTGPMAMRAGHDINYLARTGLADSSGKRETGPSLYNFQMTDVAGGSMNLMIGLLAALYYREKTGLGQYIDISMTDCAIPFNSMDAISRLAGAGMPKRETMILNGGGVYDFYETSDGKYMSVGALEPKFFAAVCKGLGHEEWADGKTYRSKDETRIIKDKLKEVFLSRTRDEWAEVFKDTDACVEPVLCFDEVVQDEHLNQRQMWPEVNLPLEPGKTIKQMGCPIKMSECPPQYRHAAYPEGWHTETFLQSVGLTKGEIEELL